jgi:hypothetical protein
MRRPDGSFIAFPAFYTTFRQVLLGTSPLPANPIFRARQLAVTMSSHLTTAGSSAALLEAARRGGGGGQEPPQDRFRLTTRFEQTLASLLLQMIETDRPPSLLAASLEQLARGLRHEL